MRATRLALLVLGSAFSVLGCGSPSTADRGHTVEEHHFVLRVKDYPVLFYCESGRLERPVHFSVECEMFPKDRAEYELVASVGTPGSQGDRLFRMYMFNVGLNWIRNGSLPHGIHVVKDEAARAVSACESWFVSKEFLKYSVEPLALAEGDEVLQFSEKVQDVRAWTPLNAKTWDDWWRALNREFAVDSLFCSSKGQR